MLEKLIKKSPLIPIGNFAFIFKDFKNKKIGFVRSIGNVGDRFIDDSARQLFVHFGIDFEEINKNPLESDEAACGRVDEFVFSGGGSMGNLYEQTAGIRRSLFKYNKPITILPQSFCNSREDLEYKKVFVREKESLKFREDAILAPDLALGYVYGGVLPEPERDTGVWLREDVERAGSLGLKSEGDPARLCNTTEEYIRLASSYKKIITDRLHFAIAGLVAGREVVLLPNSYFKNFSMYDTWLKNLGCKWVETGNCLNPDVHSIQDGISVINATKDRGENLEKALKSWLACEEVSEVIIVDWDSKSPLKILVEKFKDPRIILVEAKNQQRWMLTKAFNLAARFSTRNKILKLDADIVIDKDFFKNHIINKGEFISGTWDEKNIKHGLTGVLYCYRNDFFRAGSYDENIASYGRDDIELYDRMAALKLFDRQLHYDSLYHIPHSDNDRLKYQKRVSSIKRENSVNALRIHVRKEFDIAPLYSDFSIIPSGANHFIAEESTDFKKRREDLVKNIKELIIKRKKIYEDK